MVVEAECMLLLLAGSLFAGVSCRRSLGSVGKEEVLLVGSVLLQQDDYCYVLVWVAWVVDEAGLFCVVG